MIVMRELLPIIKIMICAKDDFLSDFRLDDNGETLVLTDKRGFTRAVQLLPYEERPQGKWIVSKDQDLYLYEFKICSVCKKEAERERSQTNDR